MTLTRLSLLALALVGFTVIGCGDKDDTAPPEGDTDTDTDADTDTDTDTDPVNYFEPYLYSWGFEGGVIGGELATLNSSHGELPPAFYFELFEKEYMNGYDDRYSCIIMYDAGGTVALAESPWLSIDFDLSTPYYTDCDNLDPNVWGSDPYAIFTGNSWELTAEEIDGDLSATFLKQLGQEKWESEYEPYVFGTQTYIDGSPIHTMQTMWGVAWSVDGTDLGDELLEIPDIAMGADGYYRMLPFYLWYVQ